MNRNPSEPRFRENETYCILPTSFEGAVLLLAHDGYKINC